MMKTCVTFAFYTRDFGKSATAAYEEEGGPGEMAKRFKFLHTFETNFDWWCVIHLRCARAAR
jgi:hypothetical protein